MSLLSALVNTQETVCNWWASGARNTSVSLAMVNCARPVWLKPVGLPMKTALVSVRRASLYRIHPFLSRFEARCRVVQSPFWDRIELFPQFSSVRPIRALL